MDLLDDDYKNVFRTVLIEAARLHVTEGNRPAFGLLMDQVETLIEWELFDRLDDFLDLVEPQAVGAVLSVCILRCSYRVRRRVLHWNTLLSKVRQFMGESPETERLLIGLTHYRPILSLVKESQQ